MPSSIALVQANQAPERLFLFFTFPCSWPLAFLIQTMQHIYIYSPSGAVRDKPAFRRGVQRLKALGYSVEVDTDALRSFQRFAGPDEVRIEAIRRAACSGAQVALISRGGYGLTRVLAQLPYDDISRSIENGMQWVGFSDFTALQLGLMAHRQRTCGHIDGGAITWAGPSLGEDFGADPALGTQADPLPDDIMEACFDDVLTGASEGAGWRVPKNERQSLETGETAFSIQNSVLWGGNLSVLSSMVGTPWMPTVDGGILFLEDVGEHPYRIERMLTQLLNAGILGRQKAVLLGHFNQYKPVPHDKGFKLSTVASWLRAQLAKSTEFCPAGVPVLTGLPFGHVPTKVLLPVGKPVDMRLLGSDALIFWE